MHSKSFKSGRGEPRNRRYLLKIEQKWTLGGLKINCRVATIDFQPSQSPFLIDFPSVTVHSFFKNPDKSEHRTGDGNSSFIWLRRFILQSQSAKGYSPERRENRSKMDSGRAENQSSLRDDWFSALPVSIFVRFPVNNNRLLSQLCSELSGKRRDPINSPPISGGRRYFQPIWSTVERENS